MQIRKPFRLVLTLGVFLVFIIYFFLNTGKFRPLLHINVLFLGLIALGNVVSIVINGLFTKIILKPFNKFISASESFYVSLISSVGNFFAPVGAGFGFRAVYLKRKYNLPYSEYISTLSGNYILVFLVNSFVGLLALYLLRDNGGGQLFALALVFGLIFICSLFLSLVPIPTTWIRNIKNVKIKAVSQVFYRIVNGWNHIAANKSLMIQLTGLVLSGLILTGAMTWMIVHSIHLSIGLAPLMLFSVLGTLSLFINITPANLGIKEAIYIFSSGILGFSVSEIVLIALIDRGILFLVLGGLWIFLQKHRNPESEQLIPQ